GRPRLVRGSGAGADHPQVAVDLHRIGVDHDTADTLGKRHRDRGLAARRRSCNKDDAPARGHDPIRLLCILVVMTPLTTPRPRAQAASMQIVVTLIGAPASGGLPASLARDV